MPAQPDRRFFLLQSFRSQPYRGLKVPKVAQWHKNLQLAMGTTLCNTRSGSNPGPAGKAELVPRSSACVGSQMRVVKQRLVEMLPDASVFLDVDVKGLKIGELESYVAASDVVLCFCSQVPPPSPSPSP